MRGVGRVANGVGPPLAALRRLAVTSCGANPKLPNPHPAVPGDTARLPAVIEQCPAHRHRSVTRSHGDTDTRSLRSAEGRHNEPKLNNEKKEQKNRSPNETATFSIFSKCFIRPHSPPPKNAVWYRHVGPIILCRQSTRIDVTTADRRLPCWNNSVKYFDYLIE